MLQYTEDGVNYRLGQERLVRARQCGVPIRGQRKYKKSAIIRRRVRQNLLICLMMTVFSLTVIYFVYGIKYVNSFFPNTRINGMDASGKTIEEFEQYVSRLSDEYTLLLEERNNKHEEITGTQIELHIEINGDLEQVLKEQKPYVWLSELWKEKTYQLDMAVTFDDELLEKAILHLKCLSPESQIQAIDAHISEYVTGEEYFIVPEKLGTEVIEEKLRKTVVEAITNLEEKISLDTSNCYKEPVISKTDLLLENMVRQMNEYADVNITYQFGEKSEVLEGERIRSWLVAGGDGKIFFDEGKVREFVKELAKTYNTAYTSRMFKTSYGDEVCVWQGHYGWMIDQEKEVQELMAALHSGESQTREPIYLQEAACHDTQDYGDTYVELNMTAQHLWLYKNGELVLDSDFVSGNLAKGYGTPNGIYPITYKERNAKLKGEGYNTGVNYWMPFNLDIGMHDARWRTTFGGTIYKTGGSHGCINLPPEIAKSVYETIEQGTAVICYTLEGTESGSVTNIAPVIRQPVTENAVQDSAETNSTGDAAVEQNIEKQVQTEEFLPEEAQELMLEAVPLEN